MKHLKWVGLLVAAILLTGIQANAQDKPAPKSGGPTLYQRIGEAPGVRLLVDSMVFKMKSDKRVGHLVKTNSDGFKKCMGQCITMVAGGPKIHCTAQAGCPGCKGKAACAKCPKDKACATCPKGKAAAGKCMCAGCTLKAMHLTGPQWDAMMEDLGWAAEHNAIGKWQKDQLLMGMKHVRAMLVTDKAPAAKPAAPKTHEAPKGHGSKHH